MEAFYASINEIGLLKLFIIKRNQQHGVLILLGILTAWNKSIEIPLDLVFIEIWHCFVFQYIKFIYNINIVAKFPSFSGTIRFVTSNRTLHKMQHFLQYSINLQQLLYNMSSYSFLKHSTLVEFNVNIQVLHSKLLIAQNTYLLTV